MKKETFDIHPCGVCGNTLFLLIFKKDSLSYEKCSNCDLIRIHPQPTDEELDAIYQNGYYEAWGGSENAFRIMKRKTFSSILGRLPKKKEKGRLLDIGAATGILMKLAQERGYEVYGVEPSLEGVKIIKEKFGANHIFNAYFDQIDFSAKGISEAFNVITMIDLFEHVREPNEALQQARSLLKVNGMISLCLPDTSALSAKIFKKNWNLYIPEHLFSFSHRNIVQLLEKNGFDILKFVTQPKYMTLDYMQGYLLRYPNGIGFLRSFLSLIPSVLKRIPILLYVGQMTIFAKKLNYERK
jgi:2-polyprenyl-3-methyl-5-hydroxy-6-metoxy-1,4-benzoquinol methylase